MKLKQLALATTLLATTVSSSAMAQSLKLNEGAAINNGGLVQEIAGRNDYYRCASFSIRVLNACIEQANRQKRSTRPCRQHYQNNMVRCQALNR